MHCAVIADDIDTGIFLKTKFGGVFYERKTRFTWNKQQARGLASLGERGPLCSLIPQIKGPNREEG